MGLTDFTVRRIRRGLVSWHWHVGAGSRRYVLRRYNPWREGIDYEHSLLEHLARERWPVAVPLKAPTGKTLVRVDGCSYSLFPFLPGRPRLNSTSELAMARGRLLASLHKAADPLLALGEREGSAPMHEYASKRSAPNGRTFTDVLPGFVRAQPQLGRKLQRHHERLAPVLAQLRDLRQTVIHGDFSNWNVLYKHNEVTGILDFDFARPDLAMADVAICTRFENDPAVWTAFVRGYLTGHSLADAQCEAFVPLRMARGLAHAVPALAFWETGRDDMLEQIQIAVDELDRDEADADALRADFEIAATER